MINCERFAFFIKMALAYLFLASSQSAMGQTIATLDATLQLRTVEGITIPYQNGIPVPSFEKQKRTTISLGGPWRKQRFAADHDLTLKRLEKSGAKIYSTQDNGAVAVTVRKKTMWIHGGNS